MMSLRRHTHAAGRFHLNCDEYLNEAIWDFWTRSINRLHFENPVKELFETRTKNLICFVLYNLA